MALPTQNAFDLFKRKFPPAVTHVDLYCKNVRAVEGDEFTPEQLAAKFSTKAWTEPEVENGKRGHSSQLTDADSVFRKFLATLPGCSEDKLSKETMLCLGILWCQGSTKAKAAQLFNLINPVG